MSSNLVLLNEVAKLQSVQITSYINVASSAALVYDYFHTLPDEVQFVWHSHWSPVNVLFYLTRYLPFIDTVGISLAYHFLPNVSSHTCSLLYFIEGYMFDFGLTIADLILIFRTWAIWNKNKKIAYSLVITALLMWGASSWAIHEHVKSAVFVDTYPSRFIGCHLDHASSIVFIAYLLLLLFETVIFALTLYKAIRSYKGQTSLLGQTLYRDGLLFYFYLFALSVMNVIILLTTYESFAGWPHRVMHAMLSARILLNIRKVTVGKVQQSDVTSTDISNQLAALEVNIILPDIKEV